MLKKAAKKSATKRMTKKRWLAHRARRLQLAGALILPSLTCLPLL
jgi:hypothetical protein